MSNPSIASKLMTKVKGLFGQKQDASADEQEPVAAEDTTRMRPAAEPTETAQATSVPASATDDKAVQAEASTAASTELSSETSGAAQTEPSQAEEFAADTAPATDAELSASEQTDGATAAEKGAVTAESAVSAESAVRPGATEEPAGDAPVASAAPENQAAIADELQAAEATTQVADESVLDRVRQDAAPSADELAVPGYDTLTLPSIRARLRKLSIDQVRDLRAYEVATSGRPEFIKMYDNRIAKLQNADQ